jgi:hypothetical protein
MICREKRECSLMVKEGEAERYNVFHVLMLMRYTKDEKLYLYDIMEIKKETSNLFPV